MSPLKFFAFSFFLILTSCNEKTKTENYLLTISSLKTDEQKEAFLLEIFQYDQKLRNLSPKVLNENNYDTQSPVYIKHIKEINLRDSINFKKVVHYLNIHGYPDFDFESELASFAITAVAIHQSYNNQLKLLPNLKKAYSDKHLSSKNFSSFLNRMHIIKFGKSFPVVNPDSLYIEQLLNKIEPDLKNNFPLITSE